MGFERGLLVMAQIKRRVRDFSRIQIHATFPVPKGMSIAPHVISQLIGEWIEGGDLQAGNVHAIDWNIEGQRKGGISLQAGETEVDRAGYIRANLIARFRRGGTISSTKIASLGQDQVKESYNEDDFDIDD